MAPVVPMASKTRVPKPVSIAAVPVVLAPMVRPAVQILTAFRVGATTVFALRAAAAMAYATEKKPTSTVVVQTATRAAKTSSVTLMKIVATALMIRATADTPTPVTIVRYFVKPSSVNFPITPRRARATTIAFLVFATRRAADNVYHTAAMICV